jgi:hypothetical protein
MRKIIIGIIVTIIALSNIFSRCSTTDEIAPSVILLGVNGKPLKYNANLNLTENDDYKGKNGENDTVIILHTKYNDPGIKVEDNKWVGEELTITSNIKDFIPDKNQGYARRSNIFKITYTATDPDGNSGNAARFVTVENLSNFITNGGNTYYNVLSESPSSLNDTTYRTTFSRHASRAGAFTFRNAYARKESDGITYRYNILGYLFSDSPNYSKTLDPNVGYMGNSDDNTKAFYEGKTYAEALEHIYDFKYIKIESQEVTSVEGGRTATIEGLNDDSSGLPKSYIVYDKSTSSVQSIYLEYEVELPNGFGPILVRETYTPLYDYVPIEGE